MSSPERDELDAIIRDTKRIAVVGMRGDGAAGRIPRYLMRAGYDVIPVNPLFPEVFGLRSLPSLDELEGGVDMVQLFRRSEDVPMHVDEIIRLQPKYVWMQSGIRNDEAAAKLAEAGIKVVQDRCLMTEHRRRHGAL